MIGNSYGRGDSIMRPTAFASRLLVVLLLLCVLIPGCFSSQAEEEQTHLTIVYLPTTKDEAVTQTARCMALSIINRWQDTDVIQLLKADGRSKLETRLDKISDVIKEEKKTNIRLQEDALQSLTDEQFTQEIWFILSTDAAKEIVANEAEDNFYAQLTQLLKNNAAKIHFVFIGDEALSFQNDIQALHELASAFGEDRLSWIQVQSDFLATETTNGLVHTGSWAIASLYGDPIEVAVTPNENQWHFVMPCNGEALVLAQPGQGFEVNDNGISREGTPFSLSYGKGNNANHYYEGLFLTGLVQGNEYCITLNQSEQADAQIKVYCYPDLSRLQPMLDVGAEDVWTREEQNIQVLLENDLGLGDAFRAELYYSYIQSGQELDAPQSSEAYEANLKENKGGWSFYVTPDQGTTAAIVQAKITLTAQDGNLLYTWTSPEQQLSVVDSDLSSIEDLAVLHFFYSSSAEEPSKVEIAWTDYFNYNPKDSVTFLINGTKDMITTDTYTIEHTEEGFILRSNGKSQIEPFEITLTAGSGTKNAKVILSIKPHDRSSFSDNFQCYWMDDSSTQEKTDFATNTDLAGKAGHTYTLRMILAADTVNLWEKAPEELKIPFKELYLSFSEEDVEDIAFSEQEDGSFAVSVKIPVESNVDNDACLPVSFYLHGLTEQPIPYSFSITISNEAPSIRKDNVSSSDFQFELSSNLSDNKVPLADLWDADSLTALFCDEETPSEELSLCLEAPDSSISIWQNNEKLTPAPEDKCYQFQAQYGDVEVLFEDKGTFDITLWASDGVNDSEPLTAHCTVTSAFDRIFIFVLVGLGTALLLLVSGLIIHHSRKPSFGAVALRCVACANIVTDSEKSIRQLLEKCHPAKLHCYGKKAISLADVLILCHQPPISKTYAELVEDIQLLPAKESCINLRYGKHARKQLNKRGDRMVENTMLNLPLGYFTITLLLTDEKGG